MTRSKAQPFTPAQIELISTFADQAVIAIETLRLFNEVQERTAETERTRQVMQTAFDNMTDGVALIDKDMRQQFMSRQQANSRRLPPELVPSGILNRRKEGFSIPAQQRLLREYAVSNNITIVQEFLDVETARRAGREHFGHMLASSRSMRKPARSSSSRRARPTSSSWCAACRARSCGTC